MCLFCVLGRALSCRRAVQPQLTKNRSCTISVAGEAQWSSPVSEVQSGTLNYAGESQVCFLGQVESYAGGKSCVHIV